MVTLVPDHNARDQLLALAMASHPRCGARSAARSFMSLPPLATSPLWEWCLRDSAVSLVVYAAIGSPHCPVCIHVTLSSALGSRIGALRTTRCVGCSLEGAPRADCLVMRRYRDRNCYVMEVFALDVASGCEACLWRGRSMSNVAVNRKWVVACSFGNDIVVYLEDKHNSSQGGVQLKLTWPDDDPDYSRFGCRGALFNKYPAGVGTGGDVDEAVVVSQTARHLFLMTLDLAKTYTTKQLVFGRCVKCPKLDYGSSFGTGIVMAKSTTGQRVVFVVLGDIGSSTVLELPADCDDLRPISRVVDAVVLSQLTSSLFCISKTDASFEIWNCNDTTGPLRTVGHRDCLYPPLIAASGFLFCRKFHDEIVVNDSHGNLVCTLRLPFEAKNGISATGFLIFTFYGYTTAIAFLVLAQMCGLAVLATGGVT
ncbi:hypothetical protein Pelo_18439 [Pelomyxa schiedti]|nr:hypothetical protein Pelo_18439 [Pelomyxa schiedti]